MSEELKKTWPETIYIYGDMNKTYQEQTDRLGWSEENFNDSVKYIRVDIAREQELSSIKDKDLYDWLHKNMP